MQPAQQATCSSDFKVTVSSHNANVMPILKWSCVMLAGDSLCYVAVPQVLSLVTLYQLPCRQTAAFGIAQVMPTTTGISFWQDSHTSGLKKHEHTQAARRPPSELPGLHVVDAYVMSLEFFFVSLFAGKAVLSVLPIQSA